MVSLEEARHLGYRILAHQICSIFTRWPAVLTDMERENLKAAQNFCQLAVADTPEASMESFYWRQCSREMPPEDVYVLVTPGHPSTHAEDVQSAKWRRSKDPDDIHGMDWFARGSYMESEGDTWWWCPIPPAPPRPHSEAFAIEAHRVAVYVASLDLSGFPPPAEAPWLRAQTILLYARTFRDQVDEDDKAFILDLFGIFK